jgi:hypothetical protein
LETSEPPARTGHRPWTHPAVRGNVG